MKKIKVYTMQSFSKECSLFIEKNEGAYMDAMRYKAIHQQKWKPFNLNTFKSPEFELCSSDSGKRNYKFDISSSSSPFYVFSEKAKEALKDILESRGQFLPIKTPSKRKQYTGYYPTNPLKGMIDLKQSNINKEDLENFGIREINNIHIKSDAIIDEYIICFSEDSGYVLVTEKFRKRVEEAGLEGFDFIYSDYEITLL